MDYGFLSVIDEQAAFLDDAADYIWEHPELAFGEFESAACLIQALRKAGFQVEENLAGIRTAFSGRFGQGSPVIGILGEFDALSGLGQVAGATEKLPDGKACGHGCGHNLLGVGSLAAAMAVKKYLEESGKPGTVIFFGCPGEEGGSGKAFMARDGVFDELDAAISWHPEPINEVRTGGSLANYQVLYKFDGISSHAGADPEKGRSALDAVELMNVGVQFLREHIEDDCRIHYAITDAGGISPNVVQPHAEVLYLIRARENAMVKELYERVNAISEGAALMTGTKASHVFIKACSNLVMNDTIQRCMQNVMEEVKPPLPSAETVEYCRKLMAESGLGDPENPVRSDVRPYAIRPASHGSTDVGDVSWVCPTAQCRIATVAVGTPGHSWQEVAQGKSERAHEMMRYAGKVMGATAVCLITDEVLLEAAKAEHRSLVGPEGYIPPIPQGVVPKAISAMGK